MSGTEDEGERGTNVVGEDVDFLVVVLRVTARGLAE